MRKVFNPGELTDEQIRHLFAELYVDGEVRVYINGVEALAFEEENWPLEKKHFYTLSDEAKKTICPNTDNVVAVHCHNAVGGCISVWGFLSVIIFLGQESVKSLEERINLCLKYTPIPCSTMSILHFLPLYRMMKWWNSTH